MPQSPSSSSTAEPPAPPAFIADASLTGATGAINRAIGWILAAAGATGLVFAMALAIEKIRLLEDPTHVPSCTIDAVLACGTVMMSDQAEAFGFPNPLLGIACFAALGTLGVVIAAGVNLPRWMWIGIQVGVTFAICFVAWLFFQSVYEIKALCPYCMGVWAATIVAFHYTTLHNLGQGNIRLPAALGPAAAFAIRYHGVLLILFFLVPITLIGIAFADHWRTVL